MTLTAEISALQEQIIQQMPEAVLNTLVNNTQALIETGMADKAIALGATFPEAELLDANRALQSLTALFQNAKTVVVFYRGSWCPYCSLELKAYRDALPEIQARGGQLVAISPMTADESLSVQEKMALPFTVLSDEGNALAHKLGLAFDLAPSVADIYRKFGFDLPRFNGDDSWTLPIPATFVVDTDGTIIYRHVNADYARRAEPEEVINAL